MSSAKIECEARFKRVCDAVACKEADRVPIVPVFQAFPIYYAGSTIDAAMGDWHEAARCYDVFYKDFKPDLGWDPILMFPKAYLQRSGINWLKWPGTHLEDKNSMYQFIEDEYMKEDEYEEAIFDITKFMMNKWMPRSFANFSGLAKLDFRNAMWFGHIGAIAKFGDPEVQASLKSLVDTAKVINDWFSFLGEYDQKLENEIGIPVLYSTFAYAPFDMIGDSMRGTTEILMDIYDRPEELLRLTEVMADFAIKDTIAAGKAAGRPWVWFWLHKGLDDFMSDEVFKKFYWPTLRRYITEVANAGLTPVVYVEGKYNTRLEYLTEVPQHKVIYSFEYSDMAAAKKVLGNHSCIMGNVPNYTLSYGTKQEVIDYCKWLIDTCAAGGGYIMDSAAMIDDAKTENIEAMFETVFTYGKK